MLNRPVQSLEESVAEFVKRVQRRNKREIVVSCILIAVFAANIAYGIVQQREDRLSIIGSAVVIFALLLNVTVVWWKLRIPRSQLSAFPPSQFPEKWKHDLTHQAEMLKLAWLWYLVPLFLGIVLFVLSIYDTFSVSTVILLVVETVFFIQAWRMNLKAAKQIEHDRDTWFNRSRIVLNNP